MILKTGELTAEKAVGYIKTGCLDPESASLQRNLILKYAEENGIELIGIYEDTGLIYSGLDSLLEAASKKGFKMVITDKLRNVFQNNEYQQLFSCGVSIYFTKPGEGMPGFLEEKRVKKKKLATLKNAYLSSKQERKEIKFAPFLV